MSVRIMEAIPVDAPHQEDPSPAMLDVPQAAELLGIGRTLAYELVRTGRWPTPIVRVGRLIRIPSGPIRELLATGRVG
jgi:excisionase family DNA binding protein